MTETNLEKAAALSEEERQMLLDWCDSRGVRVDGGSVARLGLYRSMLLDWSCRMNLTAIRDAREVLIKHFLDSLSIAPYVPRGESLLDIGSGAGFPGMVLKLVRPAQPVTLVEARGKKVGFLEHVRRSFRLEECEILHARLEGSEVGLRGRFGVVVSRGVRSPEPFLRLAATYLRPGGRIIAMLGRGQIAGGEEARKIETEIRCEIEATEKFTLPEQAGIRQLVIYRLPGGNVPRGT